MNPDLIRQIAIIAPPALLAITFHEFSHGYVAWRLGDPTASDQGRLTMNPLKHLDPIGILALFIIKIGWARPVPVNASYFKNPVKDMMWVAIAGPGANFLLAMASGLLIKVLIITAPLWPEFILSPLYQMANYSAFINLLLAFFNLLPVPPLDGSRILTGFLPTEAAMFFHRIERFGFFIILGLFYLGIIPKIIFPITKFAHNLIAG